MTKPADPSPRRRRKEARPSEILAAALSVFSERGFAAARLDDVAERAGIAKGTIYLYFSTKEELFEAVVRDAFSPVLERMTGAMALPDMSCRALVELMIRTMYVQMVATERREILRLLVAEAKRFPDLVSFYHREAISRGKAIAGEILRRGIASGEFRDSPATRYPEVLMGPAILAAVWKLVFEPVEPMDLDRMVEAHLDLVLGSIVAR
ncbi:TetR family transcriptional regulator [Sphingomonas sp. ABOLG]|jgi:AcrR family transcriptional regulator|uniref:TetR/AcrR family transcriptional regulator n=1 Tax=Sphingomonas sp. ABOLG TaxID=1985880 RepID=UPI000F7F9471|nr:TetR/AcrR family transcriptional regulator [Sphingomonas sp. ABOLG]RSV17339.1 TetR family transcriptional regulator [Sphingomonas sp. ABOLG]